MLPANTAGEYSLHNLFSVNNFLGLTSIVYRLPQQKKAHFYSGNLSEINGSIPAQATFLFSPFSTSQPAYALVPEFYQAVTIQSNTNLDLLEIPGSKIALPQTVPKEKYTGMVQKAVDEIENGKLEKVVLSRPYKKALSKDFNPLQLFVKLTEKYPDAFVYLLMSPQLGNWIAATPELLLQVEDDTLKTVALAGTRHISTGKKIPSAADFTQKEAHEQDVVTQYINNILQPFTEEIQTSSTQLKKAGNLFHLQTTFQAKLKDKNWLPVLRKLHPTPAVGGIPLLQATQFISENENYDRSLYSGFLGPINDDNANLFVNLRCMQFTQTEAVFYAGAGIVTGSDREKEWQETEHKMRTLLDVLDAL